MAASRWLAVFFVGGALIGSLAAQPASEREEQSRPAFPPDHRSPLISAPHLAHKPPRAARTAFARGILAQRKKRTVDARQYLIQAITLDPEYVEAHAELGVLYGQDRQASAALEQFEIALALEPNSEELHTDR